MSGDLGQFRPPAQPLDRRVLVHLEKLYGSPAGPPDEQRVASLRDQMRRNLRFTGTVPGMLRWWVRSADGRWFGLCDFTICDVRGATVLRQREMPVPADALEPLDWWRVPVAAWCSTPFASCIGRLSVAAGRVAGPAAAPGRR